MQISLTPKLEELLRQKMQSGLYSDESEVVREVLRMMLAQDDAYRLKLAALQQALIDGERSGPAEPLDMDRILADLDAELPAGA